MQSLVGDRINDDVDIIVKDYQRVESYENYSYHFVDTPDIDAALLDIGSEVLGEFGDLTLPEFDENVVAFVITKVSGYGGGARMLIDWIEIYRSFGKKCVVLVTKKKDCDLQVVEQIANEYDVDFVFAGGDYVYDQIISLQESLISLRPYLTFFCAFAMDVVAIAAVQPSLVNKFYLNLVLDHGCSTGLHIPHFTGVITYRPYLVYYLQKYLSFKPEKLIYVPLSKQDALGVKVNDRDYFLNDGMTIASSTSYAYKISDNYKYRFVDVVIQLILRAKVKYIHYGDILESQETYIRAEVKKIDAGLEGNFKVVPYVPNLAKALFEDGVDVLLQTFPSGGGITSVEAMQAGAKVISHKHCCSYLYNASDMLYPECFFWEHPDELYEHVLSLKMHDVAAEGGMARSFYENELNVKQYFSDEEVQGGEVDLGRVERLFDYKLDYYSYMRETERKVEIRNVEKIEYVHVKSMSVFRRFDKYCVRPIAHRLFNKNIRNKFRGVVGVKNG